MRRARWSALAVLVAPSLALASPEGTAMVPVVLAIVYATLTAFILCVLSGAFIGGYGAQRKGETLVRGILYGGLKGLGRFVIVCAVALGAAMVLSVLWTAYAFLSVYVF